MEILDHVAEVRIAEAMARGEFDALPGQGKPLPKDECDMISPELRMAYRILKNAGVVPREVALRQEIAGMQARINALPAGQEYERARRRLNGLLMQLSFERGGRSDVAGVRSYYARAL
ncbi:MAG: DUF1992 domain-containing protein [Gammaproteobacteria bacterium]